MDLKERRVEILGEQAEKLMPGKAYSFWELELEIADSSNFLGTSKLLWSPLSRIMSYPDL